MLISVSVVHVQLQGAAWTGTGLVVSWRTRWELVHTVGGRAQVFV